MTWESALKAYQNYLRLERGLAENSILNYSMDIQKLIYFVGESGSSSTPISITEDEVRQFVYEFSKKLNSRSQARVISGLRSFFEYLMFEDYRMDSPVELIESPKIGRKLPVTLSLEEI